MNEFTKRAHDVKQKLRAQGYTLKSWAEEHGYPYRSVSHVIRGLTKGYYGQGREIAEKLGLIN